MASKRFLNVEVVMCGPCGDRDTDVSQFKVPGPAPKKVFQANDSRYLNIIVPFHSNWDKKAESLFLKNFTPPGISSDLSPDDYFKVTYNGTAYFYQKSQVAKIASEVFNGPVSANNEGINKEKDVKNSDESLKQLCIIIGNVSEIAHTFLGNSADIDKVMAEARSKLKKAEHSREGAQDALAKQLKFKPHPLSETTQKESPDITRLQKQIFAAQLKTKRPTLKDKVKALNDYKSALNNYESYLSENGLRPEERESCEKVISAVDEEIRAFKHVNINGCLAEIESMDKAIVTHLNNIKKEFASKAKDGSPNGYPGVAIFQVHELLKDRRNYIDSLRDLVPSVSDSTLNLLELQHKGLTKQFNETLPQLYNFLTSDRLNVLNDLKTGKVRTTTSTFLGLGSKPRPMQEIVAEIRQIYTTLLARNLIAYDESVKKDIDALEEFKLKFPPEVLSHNDWVYQPFNNMLTLYADKYE